MKSFKQYIIEANRKNPIPVGDYDSDERGNVDHFVSSVEKARPHEITKKTIKPSEMIKNGTLKATQHHLYDEGGGDPVFPHLRRPVLVHKDGVHHILDGHHRIAWAHEKDRSIEVHVHDYKGK